MSKGKKFLVLALASFLVVLGCSSVWAAGWEPKKPVELIAPAGPGGGWDLLCRIIQKTFQEEKLINKKAIVTNKPGGGGATGWTYLKGKKGQGEYLAATSTLLILNNLLGKSDLTYKDFTVIANLQAEWIAVAVAEKSPYKTGKDLFEAIKKDPTKVIIGVGPALGNNDHISFLMLAQKYGVNPASIKFVVYPQTAAEQIPALMGGHVQAITIGLGEVLEQHKGKNLRVIGISAPKGIAVLPGVKTWKEQGVDMVFPHWRGIIAAPGLSPEQQKYWKDVFAKMVQTKTWKTEIAKLGWDPYYEDQATHTKTLERQTVEFKKSLQSVGLLPK